MPSSHHNQSLHRLYIENTYPAAAIPSAVPTHQADSQSLHLSTSHSPSSCRINSGSPSSILFHPLWVSGWPSAMRSAPTEGDPIVP